MLCNNLSTKRQQTQFNGYGILKTPTKTKDAEFIAMSLDDYSQPFNICKHIVRVMGNYLATVDDEDDVRDTLVPNPDNWIWKEATVLEARKQVWGINQKTPLGFYLEGLY